MANEYETYKFLEEDYAYTSSSTKRRRRRLRTQWNPFDLEDAEFIKRYRLNKVLARNLCDELAPAIRNPNRSTHLSVEAKVLTALSFYATGSHQRPTGNMEGHSMAQQTVSASIAQVTACLNTVEMRQKYISFPSTDQEINRIKTEFYDKFHIPGVIGCIDCTHVAIFRPVVNKEHYCCCQHNHSLKIQIVCDSNMNITSVDASHGGASHDSFIWANHPLKAHLENLSETHNIWLLGDSDYPLSNTMMTPIQDAAPNTPEALYTDLHARARNTVEGAIGLLKARFRCLLIHRVLRYTPTVVGSIVNACVILHNICNKANISVPHLSQEEVALEAQLQSSFNRAEGLPDSANIELQQGHTTRSVLIQQLWEMWQEP